MNWGVLSFGFNLYGEARKKCKWMIIQISDPILRITSTSRPHRLWLCPICERWHTNGGSEFSTAATVKSYVLGDTTPCSVEKVDRRFGGTYNHPLHVRRVSQAGNQHEYSSKITAEALLAACFMPVLTSPILRPWRRKRYAPPKRKVTFTGLHGIISQKIKLLGNMHNL
jgi:hypothetical protein